MVEDNKPFNSIEMHSFTRELGLTVITASLHHHKSNDIAERYVQSVTQFLRKAAESGGDFYKVSLAYRQTPLTGLSFRLVEMLFRRLALCFAVTIIA